MISFDEFSENNEALLNRIRTACEKCARDPATVSILPVTKTHPVEAVAFALRAGYGTVGENRVQEVVDKQTDSPSCRWELIGHLQSNKAKIAVAHFDRIQSVDSEKLMRRLDQAAAEQDKTLAVLLQINAGDDPAKFGVSIEEAPKLLESALQCQQLQIDGLMTIAPLDDDLDVARSCFERLRELRDQLEVQFSASLPELSMGMSGDLEVAVEAGSTMIRVGSALFGGRA